MAKIPVDFINFIDRVAGDLSISSNAVFAAKIDMIRSRARMLEGKEKLLMDMYFERGVSIRQMSKMSGISETTISRRVRRLKERLLGREYLVCVRNSHLLDKKCIKIASQRFIKGLSIKNIAENNKMSIYMVKKIFGKIDEIIERAAEENTPKAQEGDNV